MTDRGTRTITAPAGLAIEDTVVMDVEAAFAALAAFCEDNGFSPAVYHDAFDLFSRAAAVPGRDITVPTEITVQHTLLVHECMEAITATPVAEGLAVVAFDAVPGSTFTHSMSGDLCKLTCKSRTG